MTDILQRIRDLQFEDRSAAEALLLSFVRENLPFDTESVELRPLAVSLNSFNGFLTLADGTRLFFKTHTESNTVIDEYYNARSLDEAGYETLQPKYSSIDVGRQLLVYDVIHDPTVFDVAWRIETGDDTGFEGLQAAQEAADQDLSRIYAATLAWQSADDAAHAPVHQLFHHRIAGGRLDEFYGPATTISLPDRTLPVAELRSLRWSINDAHYNDTLDELIARADRLLRPTQAGPSIVGHGDAHNGNVFIREAERELFYFDPAFAGRHHPLLDLTKPLFHNVFAMWMYYPEDIAARTAISMKVTDDRIQVEHDYDLPSIRHMFLRSKVEHSVIPVLRDLADRAWLPVDWRAYLKASLMCCPLLTMNLTDTAKFLPSISLLGMAFVVEMGAESSGQRSLIDRTLDEVEAALGH